MFTVAVLVVVEPEDCQWPKVQVFESIPRAIDRAVEQYGVDREHIKEFGTAVVYYDDAKTEFRASINLNSYGVQ